MNEQPETTLADLVDRVKELAALGLSWEEAWPSIERHFKRLTASLSPEERARCFERLLAVHVSDGELVTPIPALSMTGEVPG